MNTLKSKKEEIKEEEITQYLFDTNFRYEQISVMIHSGVPMPKKLADEFVQIKEKTRNFIDQAMTQAKQERTEEIRTELEKAIVHATEMPNGHTTLIEVSNEFFKELHQHKNNVKT